MIQYQFAEYDAYTNSKKTFFQTPNFYLFYDEATWEWKKQTNTCFYFRFSLKNSFSVLLVI